MPSFGVQWHLTTACGNRCKHCYMGLGKRTSLPFNKARMVIDELKSIGEAWDCRIKLALTGGDPLLYTHFFPLLDYIRQEIPNAEIRIMGNPETLTEEKIERLLPYNILFYQLSLDGLEETHDTFRYKGSFRVAIERLKDMKRLGLHSAIMTTINRENMWEAPHLVDILVDLIDIYDFARLVPVGSGADLMESSLIDPLEFRSFLDCMQQKYNQHSHSTTSLGKKEILWRLYEREEGLWFPRENGQGLIWKGCNMGITSLTILEDGRVMACRRLPIYLGTIDDSLRHLFIHSETLNELRDYQRIEKCKDCELLLYCRGCRAVAYGITGDFYAPDPQCWKGRR